ncbi:CHAD domain-containing protein [Micromonospora sp. SH-82]|uniref:CYTH and CHAD domain-containing protein n=1 Tax=Micromonospora sp. SH-82 TaxID=3132938 RepID=UPI003EBFEE31
MLEEERKYEVPDEFEVPDLSPVAPTGARVESRSPVRLVATYFDTADLRLARSGVSLRHRRGEPEPWTVKLPTDTVGVRHEVSRPGPRRAGVPADLVELVTVFARGADLAPVATIRTSRRRHQVRAADGALLAEVADDRVTVLDEAGRAAGRFREVEVERRGGDADLLEQLDGLLTAAGAESGSFLPKHVRALRFVVPEQVGALGTDPEGEPDLVAPAGLPDDPTAGDVVTEAVRRAVFRLLTHDPLVRSRVPVPGSHRSALQQMRVGCRRLRSDLRTFAPLVVPEWSRPLREELRWLAGVLGAARDVEVLRARLRRTADADPLGPLDAGAVDRLDAALAARQETALAEVDEALRSPRYVALTDALVLAARAPRLRPRAAAPAAEKLPRLVRRPWRKLTASVGVDAAGLDPLGPDDHWHEVRKEAKRARYAVNAVAGVVGKDARRLAEALADVQRLLGEHQDAAVAADTWVELATASGDPLSALVAGRLVERERAAVRRVRADFPSAWARADRGRRTGWLR